MMQKAGVIKMGLYFIIKRPHRKYLGYGVDLTQVPGIIYSSPFLPLTLASNIGMKMGSILYASCRGLFSQFSTRHLGRTRKTPTPASHSYFSKNSKGSVSANHQQRKDLGSLPTHQETGKRFIWIFWSKQSVSVDPAFWVTVSWWRVCSWQKYALHT